jgi:hypothetical protein
MDHDRIESEALTALDDALSFMPAVRLADSAVEEIFFGRQVELVGDSKIVEGKPAGDGITVVRVRDSGDQFLGVGELDSFRGSVEVLRPKRLHIEAFPKRLRSIQGHGD